MSNTKHYNHFFPILIYIFSIIIQTCLLYNETITVLLSLCSMWFLETIGNCQLCLAKLRNKLICYCRVLMLFWISKETCNLICYLFFCYSFYRQNLIHVAVFVECVKYDIGCFCLEFICVDTWICCSVTVILKPRLSTTSYIDSTLYIFVAEFHLQYLKSVSKNVFSMK